jgi:periplasmic divalent cation tolerance protein
LHGDGECKFLPISSKIRGESASSACDSNGKQMNFYWVYVTTSDRDEATKIGREVVITRLAACANIIDGMRSLYWWGGAMEEADEVVLILKTRESLLTDLIACVKSLHSYDCPCVIALPIVDGNPGYLQWLADETEGAAPQL